MVLSEDVLAMTFTSDISPTLSIDGMLMDSATIASVLREAKKRAHVKELTLRNVAIDNVVAKAAEDLFCCSDSSLDSDSATSTKATVSAVATSASATVASANAAAAAAAAAVNNTLGDNSNSKNKKKNEDNKQNGDNNNNKIESRKRTWSKLEVIHCTGLISRWIKACIGHIQQFHFTGSVPIAHNPRYSLDVPSLESIGQALQDFPQLTTLNLRGTRLSPQGLQAFCSGLAKSQSLQTLQMSHCALEEPEHVIILSNALQQNQQLTAFCLSHCKFGTFTIHNTLSEREDDFFPILLESLVHHQKLQSLNIHGMYCNEQATQALSNLLRHSPCLWHLGLKNNIRHPEDKLHITNVLASLEGNSKLTYLQISGNNVDSTDMMQLGRILATSNTTLKALSLTANTIQDPGLSAFAQRLPEMKALRYLDVQRNPITQESKSQMIAALKDNMELERLDMDGTWDATKAFYLGLNRGGRRLLQSSNNCPLSLWPLVLARVNKLPFGRNQTHAHVNVLYCLLVQGPVLFQPRRTSGYKRRRQEPQDHQKEPQSQEQEQSQKYATAATTGSNTGSDTNGYSFGTGGSSSEKTIDDNSNNNTLTNEYQEEEAEGPRAKRARTLDKD